MGFSFPSQKKINDLRQKGVLSYSSWVSRLISLLTVASFFYFSGSDLVQAILGYYRSISSEDKGFTVAAGFFEERVFNFMIVPALILLALMLLGVLAQTKFYFKFNEFTFRFNRLGPKFQFGKIMPFKRLFFALTLPILVLICISLSVQTSKKLFDYFYEGKIDLLLGFTELVKSIASQIVVVALLLLILAVILNWFYFRLKYHQSDDHVEEGDSAGQRAIDSVK